MQLICLRLHLIIVIILDNKKDYYDYLSGIYGMDSLAVYDRRNSVTWPHYKDKFSLFFDPKRINSDKFIPARHRPWGLDNNYYLCVEAGKKQYLVHTERILPKEKSQEVEIHRTLVGSRLVNEKHSGAPLAVFECECHWRFNNNPEKEFDWNNLRYWGNLYYRFRGRDKEEPIVENPILADSFLVSMIPADEIWKAIYEYLISLNDKEITDNRPDALKIESAGFDLKTSFRKGKN